MTLPKDVADAVGRLATAIDDCVLVYAPEFCDRRAVSAAEARMQAEGRLTYLSGAQKDVEQLSAELLSQATEIERLRTNENLSTQQYNRLLAKYERYESRLAAAHALLRNIAACAWFEREAPATVELIQAILQGAGDE